MNQETIYNIAIYTLVILLVLLALVNLVPYMIKEGMNEIPAKEDACQEIGMQSAKTESDRKQFEYCLTYDGNAIPVEFVCEGMIDVKCLALPIQFQIDDFQ